MREATDVAASDNGGAAGNDGAGFFLAESCGYLGLVEVVGASAAATKVGIGELNDFGAGDGAEQRAGFGAYALSISEVAGVVISDAVWDVCGRRRLAQAEAGEENTHVHDAVAKRFGPGFIRRAAQN